MSMSLISMRVRLISSTIQIPPLQPSLSNPSYTIIILISIAEHGSVELTPLTLSQTVKLSFFINLPNKSNLS